MKRIAVLASGSGTNLQAIIDAVDDGTITGAQVTLVISDREDAFALERAGTIISPPCSLTEKTMPAGRSSMGDYCSFTGAADRSGDSSRVYAFNHT